MQVRTMTIPSGEDPRYPLRTRGNEGRGVEAEVAVCDRSVLMMGISIFYRHASP